MRRVVWRLVLPLVRPAIDRPYQLGWTFGKTHRIRAKYLQHRKSGYNPDYKSNPSRVTMKIGLTALALRPGCVLHVFFVQKKGDRLRAIVDCCKANVLFEPPPSVELPTGDGLSRIEVDTSGLTCGESLGLHHGCADVADFFFRLRLSGDIRRYFGWPGRSNKYLKVTEVEGAKVSPSQTLWPMCCSLPMGFSWSLHSAQSANRARLNRPSSPLRSAETTDREPPLALGHHLNVDNWTRAREILRRSAGCFMTSPYALMLAVPSVSSSTSNRCARCPPWSDFGQIRKGLRQFSRRGRVAGWELEGLMGHVTFRPPPAGDRVVPPLRPQIRSKILSSSRASLGQRPCRARSLCGGHGLHWARTRLPGVLASDVTFLTAQASASIRAAQKFR